MNIVEEKLWSYIDGTATIAEQQTMADLIRQDEQIRLKYLELLQLNSEFTAIELDEPPMAFTYNVVEAIRKEEALKPLKAGINKNIIKGISGFFILVIMGFLILLLAGINWSTGDAGSQINFKLPDVANYFTGPVVRGFLYIDVVLGLYFFNRYLRKGSMAS